MKSLLTLLLLSTLCFTRLDAKETLTGNNVAFYIDINELYATYMQENYNTFFATRGDGTTYTIQTAVDSMLTTLFTNLQSAGTNQINYFVSQLCNINDLYTGVGKSEAQESTDAIAFVLYQDYLVGSDSSTTGLNFIQYMIEKAHDVNIRADLSFGGVAATAADAVIVGPGETAAGQAVKLASFLKSYNFDQVDFDIESYILQDLFTLNSPAAVLNFFQTLHDECSKVGIETTATVLGSQTSGPKTQLAPLFQNFFSLFDSINLMLYSDTQYYLDYDNNDISPPVDWGINQWLTYVKDATKVHIGFFDSIPYEQDSATGGYNYQVQEKVPSYTRGQCAGYIYLYLLSSLATPLNTSQIGEAFWFTNLPQNMLTAPDAVAVDFYNYIQSH